MKIVLLLLLALQASATEVPPWVLRGILATETQSYYDTDGAIVYVDKRRGQSGELGPFQMTRIAFNQVRKRGEQHWQVEVNREFAEEMAIRYLLWLYHNSAKQDWYKAIEYYNAGPGHRSPVYLRRVVANGNKETGTNFDP
jgi:hypothetical protein